MTRAPLLLNGIPVPDAPVYRPPPDPPRLPPPVRPGCYPQCCGVYGAGDGGHYTDCTHPSGDCDYHPEPRRTFDHLDGSEPESPRFSAVARQMRRGYLRPGCEGPTAWWQTMPERDEPKAVSGEIGK